MKLFKLIILYLIISIFSFSQKLLCEDCSTIQCIECEISCCNDDQCAKTFFSIRSQNSNTARDLIALSQNNFHYANNPNCFFVNFIAEVQQSFNTSDIGAKLLFNEGSCASIGTSTSNRIYNINALQIGVSNSQGTGQVGFICLEPESTTLIAELSFAFKFKKLCNFWGLLNLTFAHQINKINKKLMDLTNPNFEFDSGLFTFDCSQVKGYGSICEALEANTGFGAIPKLKYGKISNKKLEKTALAGIDFDLGYDLISKCYSYLGASIRLGIPTGNRPSSKYLFEPIVGANKSTQLGATIYGGYDFNIADENKISILFDIVLTHLFKSKQNRLFNLKANGTGSQYLLLKEFNEDKTIVLSANRVANILCGEVEISSDLMFDGSVMLNIPYKCLAFNFGYNLWFRTKEKLKDKICLRNFKDNKFGLKGNTLLSCTEGIDCPGNTICGTNLQTASQSTISQSSAADAEITLITIDDINFSAPLQGTSLTNKLFTAITLNNDICNMQTAFTIGAEIEASPNCNALNQWGIMLIFEAAF